MSGRGRNYMYSVKQKERKKERKIQRNEKKCRQKMRILSIIDPPAPRSIDRQRISKYNTLLYIMLNRCC